jgi:undecaprenyl diphosphate synthase
MTPFHVAITMDGNGRWAELRGLPRTEGHRQGAVAVRRVVEAAPDSGITTLTLYAFSANNWRRPKAEVLALMTIFDKYLHARRPPRSLATVGAASGAEARGVDVGRTRARPAARD